MSLASGLPEHIDDDEPLSRFIFSSRHIAKLAGRVRGPAFLPSRDGETSVSRVKGIQDNEVWLLGDTARGSRPETLHGRADITTRAVRSVRLQVVPAEPPLRHGVIISWPETKDAQMELAQILADESTWVANPNIAT